MIITSKEVYSFASGHMTRTVHNIINCSVFEINQTAEPYGAHTDDFIYRLRIIYKVPFPKQLQVY